MLLLAEGLDRPLGNCSRSLERLIYFCRSHTDLCAVALQLASEPDFWRDADRHLRSVYSGLDHDRSFWSRR